MVMALAVSRIEEPRAKAVGSLSIELRSYELRARFLNLSVCVQID